MKELRKENKELKNQLNLAIVKIDNQGKMIVSLQKASENVHRTSISATNVNPFIKNVSLDCNKIVQVQKRRVRQA